MKERKESRKNCKQIHGKAVNICFSDILVSPDMLNFLRVCFSRSRTRCHCCISTLFETRKLNNGQFRLTRVLRPESRRFSERTWKESQNQRRYKSVHSFKHARARQKLNVLFYPLEQTSGVKNAWIKCKIG